MATATLSDPRLVSGIFSLGCLALRRVVTKPACLGTALLMGVHLAAVSPASGAAGGPLAEVNGEAITSEEVEEALGAPLRNLEEHIYRLKRHKVEELISQRLLAREAASRGISVQALVDAEVVVKTGVVTEQEVETLYRANRDRVKGDEAQIRERIRGYLRNQKLTSRREAFLRSLRSQVGVVVHLQAPPVFRADVAVDGAPFRGPAAAPVAIVEFSDFHCPFCQQVASTLRQLLSRYDDKVKLVHRDFPNENIHPEATKAAEAARCAHEQGKFWEYHDALFANAPKATQEQLGVYARQVGLEVPSFERCLASGRQVPAVQRDVNEGTRLGVTGTPAFFINGRLLSGAQPLESFVRVIEEELVQTGASEPDGHRGAR
jgi:protein-disulfide isomerase